MNRIVIVLFFLLTFISCSQRFNKLPYEGSGFQYKKLNLHKTQDWKRFQKISSCQYSWNYEIIRDTVNLRVIQYIPAYKNDNFYRENIPAMIIGIVGHDTIRVFIYKNMKKIAKDQSIFVTSDQSFNEIIEPPKTLSSSISIPSLYPTKLTRNKQEDSYYCKVKKTIYGLLLN